MLRKAAMVFGAVFLVVGALGFVPALTPGNNLLGLFAVGTVHNLIHLLSGVAALVASKSDSYSKTYFRVFGVVYGIVAVVGFIQGTSILGIFPINMADNLLHTVIAAASLYLGFANSSRLATA